MKPTRTFVFFSVLAVTLAFPFLQVTITAAGVPAAYTPPTMVSVRMYQLTPGDVRRGPNALCTSGSTAWGCTAFCNEPGYPCAGGQILPYPYTPTTATVPIETDYLLDVVSRETPPDDYHFTAVQAEAIAARTLAYFYIQKPPEPPQLPFNNSAGNYQSFIPYMFDSLYPATFPTNSSDPCASSNLNTLQRLACAAVAPRYYLSSSASDLPAFVRYVNDSWARTDVDAGTLHLKAVDDPISTGCDADPNAHGPGMSQKGASRWARGNRCAFSTEGSDPWSVRWDRVEQILVHYYTGVHLRDANTTILTPNYRWNPLYIQWGTPDNRPPILYHGSPRTISVQMQNTGVADWTCGYPYLDFSLGYHWVKAGFGEVSSSHQVSVCGTPKGDPAPTMALTIADIPPWGPGVYTIRFDIHVISLAKTIGDFWFSSYGNNWPTYDVSLCVDGPCQVFLPLALKDYSVPTDTYEPNDSRDQAWQIYAGGVYDSYVWYEGDNDYYKFILSRGVVQIQLTNIPAGCNYDLYLYDAEGKELTKSVNPDQNNEEVTWSVSTGNTYYVRVHPVYGYSQSNPYHLRLNWWPGLKQPSASPPPYPGPS